MTQMKEFLAKKIMLNFTPIILGKFSRILLKKKFFLIENKVMEKIKIEP